MARRATFFNQVWDQGVTTLVLDGGDLFGNRNAEEKAISEFLAAQTARFGYDAIGLGERDLNFGHAFLQQVIAEHGLPFTNANVRNAATGALILPEFLIVERGGLRFGVCSVMDPAYRIISMAAQDIEYEVADPVVTVRELLPRLRQQCDTVVLLSHLGDRATEQLLNEVSGIDIAVSAHHFRSLMQPRMVKDAVLLAAVHEGRVIGRADLSLSRATGQVMSVQVAITTLDAAVEDDPVMLAAVQEFLSQAESRRQARRSQFPRILGSRSETFLGDNACKGCHTSIHGKWRQTTHARTFTKLRVSNSQTEPECLTCHTTGYRYFNGFDDNKQLNLANVQCEACHGYGSDHRRNGEMRWLARESCTQCHDNSLRPCFDSAKHRDFNYARFWESIAH